MFNSQSYSLADIAAVTGGSRSNNDTFGDGNGWWIIVLLLLFGWDNNGYGGFGGERGNGPAGEGQLTRAALYDGFATNGIERGIASIQSGICDGFYTMNNGMLTGFAGVQNALCQGFSGINAGMTQNTNDITRAINADAGMEIREPHGSLIFFYYSVLIGRAIALV